jgi:hypothetical protein
LRSPISGAQFRRDVKLAQKRGKDMAKLREVIQLLIEGKLLPAGAATWTTGKRLPSMKWATWL